MLISEPITDANFIEIKGKVMNDGQPAYALYCSSCLAIEQRVKDPKAAIDKETLQEFTLDGLKDASSSSSSEPAVAAEPKQ